MWVPWHRMPVGHVVWIYKMQLMTKGQAGSRGRTYLENNIKGKMNTSCDKPTHLSKTASACTTIPTNRIYTAVRDGFLYGYWRQWMFDGRRHKSWRTSVNVRVDVRKGPDGFLHECWWTSVNVLMDFNKYSDWGPYKSWQTSINLHPYKSWQTSMNLLMDVRIKDNKRPWMIWWTSV